MFNLNGNWIDLIIVLTLAYFMSRAWSSGFWVSLAGFISFLGSLVISLSAYHYAGQFITDQFSLSQAVANALGFLFVALISEMILGFLLITAFSHLSKKAIKGTTSRVLAVAPAVGEALVLVSFLLVLAVSLPLRPAIKADIVNSKIGGELVNRTSGLETSLKDIFGGAIEETLTYLTVQPGSDESVPLNIGELSLEVDGQAEAQMFAMVNRERARQGFNMLSWSDAALPVARAHARDMWERDYFGHTSPDGQDVGDRLQGANVKYEIAGENLALAPTTQTAHTGLMNSDGHRANILEPRFRQLAIGVIDNGIYGKMYVQVFTD